MVFEAGRCIGRGGQQREDKGRTVSPRRRWIANQIKGCGRSELEPEQGAAIPIGAQEQPNKTVERGCFSS